MNGGRDVGKWFRTGVVAQWLVAAAPKHSSGSAKNLPMEATPASDSPCSTKPAIHNPVQFPTNRTSFCPPESKLSSSHKDLGEKKLAL